VHEYAFKLNNNKYFVGMMMVMLNLGSRYIFLELGKSHDAFFNQKIVRRLLIFTIFFVATRDIIASMLLTVIFIVFFLELTHENSKYCILPKGMIKLDTNDDGYVTADEVKRAYFTLKNAGQIEQFRNSKKKT
jgi:uncharacterized membrane protein